MPFLRPSVRELMDRNDSQISSRLGIGRLMRRSVLGAFSFVIAGASHMLHGFIGWAADQILPDTSEGSILTRQAAIKGIERATAAFAEGKVDFTFSQAGELVSGTKLRRSDGVEYEVSVGIAPSSAGTFQVLTRALVAAASGNVEAGAALTLVSPVAYVSQSAVVVLMNGGADIGTDEELRAELLAAWREPPHGGAMHDYRLWTLPISEVTRVWPSSPEAGTVWVTFVVDDSPTGPIPDAAKVQEVQDILDVARPVGTELLVFAPGPISLDPVIRLTPNSPVVQAAVTDALSDLLRREAVPGGTLLISHIREAISLAAGETDHELTSPAGDVVLVGSQLSVLGAITWQS